MNKLLTYLWTGLLFSQASFAVNPEQGLYAGILLGPSWAPAITLNTSPSFELTYQVMGQLGGQVGYRWDKVRTELEFFYNSNPYSDIVYNNVTYTANKSTDTFFTGQTNLMFAMFNLYYDLLPPANVDSNFAPFIGIGAGYGNSQNTLSLTYNSVQVTPSDLGRSHTSYGGQVIGGLLAFLDDFSYFIIDLRYFTTPNYTQNITFLNGSTQEISYKNQTISVNLSFNGAINL